MITPDTFTGLPARSVGLKIAERAASTAALLSSGWPLTAVADVTRPPSSTSTWTVTAPDALTARAAGGYGGLGRLTAFPLSTPPEIVFGGTLAVDGVAIGLFDLAL